MDVSPKNKKRVTLPSPVGVRGSLLYKSMNVENPTEKFKLKHTITGRSPNAVTNQRKSILNPHSFKQFNILQKTEQPAGDHWKPKMSRLS